MNFRETLGRHLLAIETRDLDTLAETIADSLILIMADGKLKRTKGDFMEAHRAWFAMPGWTLTAKPVESYLTLVFERQGDAWLMVQDQNTPIKS